MPFKGNRDGTVLWFVRNFEVISQFDQFSYEVRVDFAPGYGTQIGPEEIGIVILKGQASCLRATTQILEDTGYTAGGKIVIKNLIVEKEPSRPLNGSYEMDLLNIVCGHGVEKKKPVKEA